MSRLRTDRRTARAAGAAARACAPAARASSDGPAIADRRPLGGCRGGQPGGRLAAAGHPRRVPAARRSASSAWRARACQRARGRLAQRRARGRAARLLDGDRRELPAGASVHPGRARDGERAGADGRRDAFGEHDVHGRPPRRRSARKSSRSTRATRMRCSTTRTAPSLTPSTVTITTPARPGAAPGDLFLAPYQGVGTAGPDDRRTGRPARVVPPAARRRGVDRTSRCSSTKASPCSRGGRGASWKSASARAKT